MEELPSNAHSARRQGSNDAGDKKIERVVVGPVSRRRKPLGARLREMFVAGNTDSVAQYVLFDVILPAAKDAIADAVSQGIEKMLFGEARSTSRRTGARPGSSGYVSYNRYGPQQRNWSPTSPRDSQRQQTTRTRTNHNFDDVILATRAEAEEVVDNLFNLVNKYEQATVSDLCELVGIPSNFTDEKWGWTNIRGAGVTRVSNGYLLDLPRPEPLD